MRDLPIRVRIEIGGWRLPGDCPLSAWVFPWHKRKEVLAICDEAQEKLRQVALAVEAEDKEEKPPI